MLIIIVFMLVGSVIGFYQPAFQELMIWSNAHYREYWRWVSHAFVHADWGHLFVNAWVLFNFGSVFPYELVEGTGLSQNGLTILIFLVGVVAGNIPSFSRRKQQPHYRALGASAGVSSVLFVFIVCTPLSSLYLLFIPFPIPAFIFGFLYLIYEYQMNKRAQGRVAHDAHLAGIVGGLLFLVIMYPQAYAYFWDAIVSYIWN